MNNLGLTMGSFKASYNNMGKDNHAHLPSIDANKRYETKLTSTERFIYNFPGYNTAEPLHVQQQ